jgi:pimeloyl-ACP methyl ester carboxylesterase
MSRTRRSSRRWLLGLVGLIFVALAVWQIDAAAQGLEITTLQSSVPPMTFISPAGAIPGSRPLVLIAHGFAGSGLIMRQFAFTLAHAGYATVSWDFDGHGANPRLLSSQPLLADAEAAVAEATTRGLVTPGKMAILGHSMGSGVALEFGQVYSDTAATIAISPVGQTVTMSLPHNLLLMAGSLEPQFRTNAERHLAEAGGAGGDAQQGTARRLTVIENVEHITILFNPATQREALAWLDATFGRQPGATAYTDLRIAWYGLGLLGALLIAAFLGSLLWSGVRQPEQQRVPALWRRLVALAIGALAASVLLWLVAMAGLQLRTLFGMLIGGYMMVWFAVAGVVSWLLMGTSSPLPSARAVVGGLLAFAALWLGVGLLGQQVFYQWLLIWPRLRYWPLAVLLLLPWFLAVGQLVSGSGLAGRLGQWLAHSIVLTVGLYVAIRLSPDLGFLFLILPLFPIVLFVYALATIPHRGSWPYALSGALFTAWLLLAVFPLQ